MYNHYNLSSHWSNDLAIALDHHCDSHLLSGGLNPNRVSVYYETEGTEKNKVLEFGCNAFASSHFTNSPDITARLLDINNRYKVHPPPPPTRPGMVWKTHHKLTAQAVESLILVHWSLCKAKQRHLVASLFMQSSCK